MSRCWYWVAWHFTMLFCIRFELILISTEEEVSGTKYLVPRNVELSNTVQLNGSCSILSGQLISPYGCLTVEALICWFDPEWLTTVYFLLIQLVHDRCSAEWPPWPMLSWSISWFDLPTWCSILCTLYFLDFVFIRCLHNLASNMKWSTIKYWWWTWRLAIREQEHL